MKANESFLVLANGPSLKGIDIKNLSGPTVGMNAAYRFWRQIDWYPEYYVCLDAQLIETHREFLVEASKNNTFRGMFLHQSAGQIGLVENGTQLLFLDEVRALFGNPRKKGKHLAFRTRNNLAVTTGSWAIRYAAYLGASEINLAGYDLNYKEKKGARKLGLTGKVADGTGDENYFFSGYQKAGDRYNTANPRFYPFDLHKHSVFLAVRELAKLPEPIRFQFISGHPELRSLISSL